MYLYYKALVTGDSSLMGAINVSPAVVGVSATSALTGGGAVVAAPALGAAIATINGLTAGTWEVEVTTFVGGTTAAVDASNMQFRVGATGSGTIITPVPGTTGATGVGTFKTRINLTGTSNISVNAIAAATAGSNYYASIVARKIGF